MLKCMYLLGLLYSTEPNYFLNMFLAISFSNGGYWLRVRKRRNLRSMKTIVLMVLKRRIQMKRSTMGCAMSARGSCLRGTTSMTSLTRAARRWSAEQVNGSTNYTIRSLRTRRQRRSCAKTRRPGPFQEMKWSYGCCMFGRSFACMTLK